ncbi:MAG: hypothetical protein IJY10_01505, partial [Lachnospiraceae bacterium]|nr:hypothetical protein [Lachnospiraceae bacterium]
NMFYCAYSNTEKEMTEDVFGIIVSFYFQPAVDYKIPSFCASTSLRISLCTPLLPTASSPTQKSHPVKGGF